MTAHPSRGTSLRSPRVLLAVLATGWLAGCASLPQPLSNALGRIPVVSLLIDRAQVEEMARRFEDGSMSEAEARAIEARELPPPPGVSHDLAALRRATAALLAGRLEAAAAAALLVVRHGSAEELKIIGLNFASEVEQIRGRLQTALRYSADAERRWLALAHAARAKGQPVPRYDFGRHIGVARVAGRFDEAERLQRAYATWRPQLREGSSLEVLMSDVDFEREKAEVLATFGHFDAAYATAAGAMQTYRAGVASAKPQDGLPAVQQALARGKHETLLRLLVKASINQGQLAKAAQHLDELRAVVAANGNKRASLAGLHDAENLLLAYGADYAAAAEKMDQAWALQPAAVRNAGLPQLQRASFKGVALALHGDLPGAHAALMQVGAPALAEDSLLRDVHRAGIVAVSAMLGRFAPPPQSLEPADLRYLGHLASDHALLHFGAKVIGYERRGTHRGSLADHVQAVRNGRLFSRGLRALQLSGEMRALPLIERYLSLVKESYLAAASTALGHGGVDSADLLDALSLLQRTETDDDIVAAAARQRVVPGVTAVQLRQLQDLRLAARTAQRELMAYGKSVEADSQRAAELGRAALAASERLLDFVRSLQQAAPRLYDALAPDALALGPLQMRLGADEALASISILPDRTHVLLVTRSGIHQRLVPLARDEARTAVQRIRASVVFDERTGALPPFAADAATLLHERLFGWAAVEMQRVRHLTVVAGDALASIPFGLLIQRPLPGDRAAGRDGPPWLIRSMAVSHMPSLASWRAVAGRSMGDEAASFVAWADPAFERGQVAVAETDTRGVRRLMRAARRGSAIDAAKLPSDLASWFPRLANTRPEAEAIALVLGGSRDDVIAGERATRSSVLSLSRSGALRRKSVLMFATHGVAPAQIPGLAQPALVLAQEPDEALPSLLALDDVVGLDLKADWVLLSACNTSASDRPGGDALSGLARGFFFAGASSLLVTHWAVESDSAAAITTMTMAHLKRDRRLNRAQALQRTAVDMIEARNTPAAWAHPAYWAPYALVGSAAR